MKETSSVRAAQRHRKLQWLRVILAATAFALAGSISGCTDSGDPADQEDEVEEEEEVQESAAARRTPRTFYGQSVGRAKDLTRSLNSHDQGMFRQADELGDD